MDNQHQFFKRLLLISLPLLGGFTLGGLVLDRQFSPSVSQSAPDRATLPASPSPSQLKVLPGPVIETSTLKRGTASSSITLSPSPSPKAVIPSVQPTLRPIDPGALTAEQKAQNQKARAAFLAAAPTVDSLIEMRVAIAEGVLALELRASEGATVVDAQGRSLQQLAPGATYSIAAGNQSIILAGQSLPEMVWVLPAPDSTFNLGDRQYRGKLLLVVDRGSLWGVNHVDLRQYLASVVASEVSASWPTEALKAQAVAARSYALTYYLKPVTSLYQLGATEYYQVYGGIDREAERTSQAVDSTAGEFVSHRGGVVESLYAASDDIVAEAFAGKGMSQLGALELAKQGYGYQQILSHYYPGTGVGRVTADMN
ncbi:MAG TPA: SpoIID/LytB domain-containing protein [Coleofasciculaceae cyanobacterium]